MRFSEFLLGENKKFAGELHMQQIRRVNTFVTFLQVMQQQ